MRLVMDSLLGSEGLLDDNLSGHLGMDGAEIVVGAGRLEYMGELVVGIHGAGVKELWLGGAGP